MRSHLLALTFIYTYGSLAAAEPNFVAAVTATRPIAFYRFNAASGGSEVGATAYSAKGTVTTAPASSEAPANPSNSTAPTPTS